MGILLRIKSDPSYSWVPEQNHASVSGGQYKQLTKTSRWDSAPDWGTHRLNSSYEAGNEVPRLGVHKPCRAVSASSLSASANEIVSPSPGATRRTHSSMLMRCSWNAVAGRSAAADAFAAISASDGPSARRRWRRAIRAARQSACSVTVMNPRSSQGRTGSVSRSGSPSLRACRTRGASPSRWRSAGGGGGRSGDRSVSCRPLVDQRDGVEKPDHEHEYRRHDERKRVREREHDTVRSDRCN